MKSEKEMRALFPDHPEAHRQHRSAWRTSASSTSRSATSCRASRARRVRHRRGAPGPPRAGGDGAALRHPPAPARCWSGWSTSSGSSTRAGYAGYFLIVQDFIAAARERGHPGRAGPRFRGRLAGGLRAPHHRRGPAPVRPAVRAVPEPRARLDARHRRGLLLRAARRGDRVRAAAVRAGERRADRHLRHHEGARGGQGRGPRPQDRPRRRGQDHQADPLRPRAST